VGWVVVSGSITLSPRDTSAGFTQPNLICRVSSCGRGIAFSPRYSCAGLCWKRNLVSWIGSVTLAPGNARVGLSEIDRVCWIGSSDGVSLPPANLAARLPEFNRVGLRNRIALLLASPCDYRAGLAEIDGVYWKTWCL